MAKDTLKYTNHKGQSILFGENGLYIEESELRDWGFSYNSKNGAITTFYKDVAEKKIPVVISADSEEEGQQLRDELYNIISIDSESGKRGKLTYNGYEMECFITAVKHSSWLEYYAFGDIELTVITDRPYWVKKTAYEFNAAQFTSAELAGSKAYPNDYNYDYGLAVVNGSIENTSALPMGAEIEIKGYALNPEIKIGNQSYKINYEIPNNCTAIINTVEKTILLKLSLIHI